jgi:hypothetical protein
MVARNECGRVQNDDSYLRHPDWFTSDVFNRMKKPDSDNEFSRAIDAVGTLIGGMNDAQVKTLVIEMTELTKSSNVTEEYKRHILLVHDVVREFAFYRGLIDGEEPVPSSRWASYEPGQQAGLSGVTETH